MPSPSSSLSTLRPDLETSFEEFSLLQNMAGFIGQKVLPISEVAKETGTFGKIPVEELLQARDTKRAPGSGYNRGDWSFTPTTYACQEHGAEEPVDDREAQLYADFFDAEQVSRDRALSAVLLNAEQRVADAVFNATTFSSFTTAITNEWDDYSNAIPVQDVNNARNSVFDQCGMYPNAVIMNRKVFNNCRLTSEVKSAIEASGAGSASAMGGFTAAQLATVFDVDYVIVAGGAKNTANEGQSASLSHIWSDEYVMVCRVATGNDFREACIGRTFHWSQDGSQPGGTVESYRAENLRSDIIRVRHDVDELILYPECGHLLSNATT